MKTKSAKEIKAKFNALRKQRMAKLQKKSDMLGRQLYAAEKLVERLENTIGDIESQLDEIADRIDTQEDKALGTAGFCEHCGQKKQGH